MTEEQEKIALSMARAFVEEEVVKQEVFFYPAEVNCPELHHSLPAKRCVKVTIEYSDFPE